MEIRRQAETLEISELDPFLAELLRQIPESTKPDGVEAAEQRLFSLPAEPDGKGTLRGMEALRRTGAAPAFPKCD